MFHIKIFLIFHFSFASKNVHAEPLGAFGEFCDLSYQHHELLYHQIHTSALLQNFPAYHKYQRYYWVFHSQDAEQHHQANANDWLMA